MRYITILSVILLGILFAAPAYAVNKIADINVVPSPNCLSSKPCTTNIRSAAPSIASQVSATPTTTSQPSSSSAPSPAPSGNANPSAVPSSTPPCSTSQSSVSSKSIRTVHSLGGGDKKHYSGRQGFLQQFFLFLWQLLQIIFQKLGIQVPTITIPCGSSSSPSGTPATSGTPSTAPSSGAGGNGGTTPSSTPSKAANPTNATATQAPSAAPSSGATGSNVEPVGISGSWSLVFDDEFNGTSLNPTYWNDTWFSGGTMNNVSTSASNVAVSGGDLILTLSSPSVGALVDTDPGQASTGFQFGTGYYIEGRINFPGSGSTVYNWPAFWTDGQTWPQDGETDIAEGLGTLTSNYWYGTGNGTANNSNTIAGMWSNGWHTYGLDREANTNYIYWDGKLIRSYTTYDNGAPEYLLFNVGCSGNCVTGAASQLKVDYVRVWKKQ